MNKKDLSRRALIKKAALAGAAVGATGQLFATGHSSYVSMSKNTTVGFGDLLIQPEYEGKEKHAPRISAPGKVKAGEPFEVEIFVGKEKHHPNTTVHHIKWIQVFAKETGKNPMAHVATFDLGPGYAEPKVKLPILLDKTASLHVLAYCNLHGVWENSVKINVQ